MQDTLPIVRAGAEDLLTSLDGRPAWPIRTADELHALTQLAEVLGAGLREVRAHSGRADAGPETVVALGQDVEQVAQLYAHLTQRCLRVAADAAELIDGGLPAVVITTPRFLSSELLDTLYPSQSETTVPGIICASAPAMLRRQVLLRSAAAALVGAAETMRIDVLPFLASIDSLDAPYLKVVGGKATPDVVRSALGQGGGVLTVTTKADGIDAFLGARLTLCPMDRLPNAADEARSPRCHITGICHRHMLSRREALDSGTLLSPDVVRARILVWNACFGLLTPQHVLDPSWGLGTRWFESCTIGAIVTTWDMNVASSAHSTSLAQDLMQGLPVGQALAQFNRSSKSRQLGQRMCLLGDPRVRLPKQNKSTDYGGRHETKVGSVKHVRARELREVALLRACMGQMSSNAREDLAALAIEASKAIQVYEAEAWRGVFRSGTPEPPGDRMRRAVMEVVFLRHRLADEWMPFTRALRAEKSPAPCFVCGARPKALIAHFRIPGVSPRQFMTCSRCAAWEDVPIGSHISFSLLQGGCARLDGATLTDDCKAGVYLVSSLPTDNFLLEWPIGPDGTPTQVMQLPQPLPLGPLRLSVVVLWGGQFAIISQMVRGRG